MNGIIHIAIPSDDAYWFYAMVTAASALKDSSEALEVHILDGGISEEHRECMQRALSSYSGCRSVSFHALDIERLRKCGQWHGSPVAYSRLFLASILPEDIEWVISADADTFFRGDIAELWDLRDNDVSIVASRDCPLPTQPYNLAQMDWYERKCFKIERPCDLFCDGLCLVNLKRWRKYGFEAKFEAFAHSNVDTPYADQTILNYLLQGANKLLPRNWGCFSGDESEDVDWKRSGCVHFVEDPPWRRWKCTHLMSDLVLEWWDLAERIALDCGLVFDGFRGCRNRLDYAWRRAAFAFLKKNQWVLNIHPALKLHLRSTRGISR